MVEKIFAVSIHRSFVGRQKGEGLNVVRVVSLDIEFREMGRNGDVAVSGDPMADLADHWNERGTRLYTYDLGIRIGFSTANGYLN